MIIIQDLSSEFSIQK